MEPPSHPFLSGCLKGEPPAQRQLYEAFKVPMFRLCLRYAGSREEAEDMLQEGFIKVFTDLQQYRGEGPLAGWVRRVVLNVVLQHLRRQKNTPVALDVQDIPDVPDEDTDNLFGELRARALAALVQRLPPGYRTVFNLFVMEGHSHREIADILDISESTSKSQLSKAKAMLRRMLEKSLTS
ncbi:MAG: sigma-70 family RNA polymerase sigma factor [Lewinellaceae bacterium]|nr:sigma-70 family RNA polymerase sigma factor [Lewinellaceae bacterium]